MSNVNQGQPAAASGSTSKSDPADPRWDWVMEARVPLLRFVYLSLHLKSKNATQQDAEDLLQDVLISVFRASRSRSGNVPEDKDEFRWYLIRCLTNRVLRWVKKDAKRSDCEPLVRRDADGIEYELQVPGPKSDPESQIFHSEVLLRLNELLSRKEITERRAIQGFFFDGLSCREIADALRVPQNTVKSWVRRFRTRLVISTGRKPRSVGSPVKGGHRG
jgi:RNA polymerase sigma factor (sigma-70 family)